MISNQYAWTWRQLALFIALIVASVPFYKWGPIAAFSFLINISSGIAGAMLIPSMNRSVTPVMGGMIGSFICPAIVAVISTIGPNRGPLDEGLPHEIALALILLLSSSLIIGAPSGYVAGLLAKRDSTGEPISNEQ